MKNHQQAEAHVLDRMMHLLEENSVTHLMAEDKTFAAYITDLYEKIDAKSQHLRRTAV